MSFTVFPMTIEDYDEVHALWSRTPGVGLSAADERPAIAYFLEHNPGLSFVARADGQVVGAVICGTDGRRGYLHHLAVATTHRRMGIGKELTRRVLEQLSAMDLQKCHIFVYGDNQDGLIFWKQIGLKVRTELVLMSKEISRPN